MGMTHTGLPDTSRRADPAPARLCHLETVVWRILRRAGSQGMISDEVRDIAAAEFGVECYSSITARYGAMHGKGYLGYTGATRQGRSGKRQRVMVALDQPEPGDA